MIKPSDMPHGFENCWSSYVGVNKDPDDAGWYAVNSVDPKNCIPSYRVAGGGVSAVNLIDFPKAVDRSIWHLKQRIHVAQTMIESLQKLKEAVDEN